MVLGIDQVGQSFRAGEPVGGLREVQMEASREQTDAEKSSSSADLRLKEAQIQLENLHPSTPVAEAAKLVLSLLENGAKKRAEGFRKDAEKRRSAKEKGQAELKARQDRWADVQQKARLLEIAQKDTARVYAESGIKSGLSLEGKLKRAFDTIQHLLDSVTNPIIEWRVNVDSRIETQRSEGAAKYGAIAEKLGKVSKDIADAFVAIETKISGEAVDKKDDASLDRDQAANGLSDTKAMFEKSMNDSSTHFADAARAEVMQKDVIDVQGQEDVVNSARQNITTEINS